MTQTALKSILFETSQLVLDNTRLSRFLIVVNSNACDVPPHIKVEWGKRLDTGWLLPPTVVLYFFIELVQKFLYISKSSKKRLKKVKTFVAFLSV